MVNRRILISGAGIAGFTLAYWLKKRGFLPTIVEKYPGARKGGYKVDVRGTALDVIKRMGIYQDLLDVNVNLTSSKLVTPNFKILEFEGDILGHVSEDDIEINRWDLAEILKKAVGDIEIIYGDSITKIEEMVHFEKMAPRAFDVVVGADGLFSNVRRLVFGEDSKFLRNYGIHFCVFPIDNMFNLDRCEIVYMDKGKLVAAYAVNEHSYACLAIKSKKEAPSSEELKSFFEKEYAGLGWEIPTLIKEMQSSKDCYFNAIAQVRMPAWSKGKAVLVGDAAYAASAMGTSLAIVGAYVLAEEIEEASGDCSVAFSNYEKSIRKFVEEAQDLAESNQELFSEEGSSFRTMLQFYLIKLMPRKFIQFITKKGREKMKRVARGYKLEPLQSHTKSL
ncbi:MAG: hypothetical protein JSR76_04545 [Verrucomicrobia bacterium]|nr:hypothetical protein [Verrucomicrobiota bacterium]